ncbi:hypothetical protein DPMN_175396 [Dreissena polymorpha]|uniref:Integrin beta subunit tail domain-containing protein n=1 Tax=Dreissena polymorpha TaxID=45954 RepID=A0A9D4E7T3_DREPO|nr:hypothetical protein DPMN_175396 [Dreissena polymorpha]
MDRYSSITSMFAIFTVLCLVMSSVWSDKCDDRNCQASNGAICNSQGSCMCGECACEGEYSGPTCEECPTCPSPCEVFKGCVGCKIFGTGPIGVIECVSRCDFVANYIPIEKEDFDEVEDEMMLCSYFNEEYCLESFKIGDMSEGYRDLFVRTDINCSMPIPTTTTTMSVIEIDVTEDSSDVDNSDSGYKNSKPVDPQAASGSGNASNNASAATFGASGIVLLVFSVLAFRL